jgi:hypothetical protein
LVARFIGTPDAAGFIARIDRGADEKNFNRGRMTMRKMLIVGAAALTLGGCQTVAQDRALTGAAIGGVTGAAIGGIAGRSAGAAVAGGAIGAVAGGIIGHATTPRDCYVRTRSGRVRRVAC